MFGFHRYAIIMTLLGVVVLGLVIGHMTSLFVNLDSTSAAFKSDLDVMEHVMSISSGGSNKIDLPVKLRLQIRTYSEYLWTKQRGLLDAQIQEGLPTLIQDRIADMEIKRMPACSSTPWRAHTAFASMSAQFC